MSPEATFICYFVAFVAFLVAIIMAVVEPRVPDKVYRIAIAVGLFFWLTPTFWAAMKAL